METIIVDNLASEDQFDGENAITGMTKATDGSWEVSSLNGLALFRPVKGDWIINLVDEIYIVLKDSQYKILRAAIDDAISIPVFNYIGNDATNGMQWDAAKGCFVIEQATGRYLVTSGDYILQFDDKNRSLVTDTHFDQQFIVAVNPDGYAALTQD